MTRAEYLLACLAEECDEVGQRTMKALRFSLQEVQAGQSLNNALRIAAELKDLIAVATLCHQEGLLPYFKPCEEEYQAKVAKIEKFMAISRETGALS